MTTRMSARRALTGTLVALGALGFGAVTALAAGALNPAFNSQTVAVSTPFTATLGHVTQDAATDPIGANVDWGDGSGQESATLRCPVQQDGRCEIIGGHTYTAAGVYTVQNTVSAIVDGLGTATVVQATATVRGRALPSVGIVPINLGTTPVGATSAAVPVPVFNDPGAELPATIGRISLLGDDPGDFLVDRGTCAQGAAPGSSCSVAVRLRPSATGPRSATLRLDVNDAPDNGVELRLDGVGAPALPPETTTVERTVTSEPITIAGPPSAARPAVTTTVSGPQRTITISGPPAAAPRCVVPTVKGKSVSAARKALERADCALGRVTKPRGARGKLVVASQNPAAGARRAQGTKVAVRLKRR